MSRIKTAQNKCSILRGNIRTRIAYTAVALFLPRVWSGRNRRGMLSKAADPSCVLSSASIQILHSNAHRALATTPSVVTVAAYRDGPQRRKSRRSNTPRPQPSPHHISDNSTISDRRPGRGAAKSDRNHSEQSILLLKVSSRAEGAGDAMSPIERQQMERPLQPLRLRRTSNTTSSPIPRQPRSAPPEREGLMAPAAVAGLEDSSSSTLPLSVPHMLADPLGSELGCARFGLCSGCSLQNGLAAPPLYSEAVEFFRQLGLSELPAVMRAAQGWRCRAKLAVRGHPGRPLIGLFREGSHECIDIVGAAVPPPPPPLKPRETTSTSLERSQESPCGTSPSLVANLDPDHNGFGKIGDTVLPSGAPSGRRYEAMSLPNQLRSTGAATVDARRGQASGSGGSGAGRQSRSIGSSRSGCDSGGVDWPDGDEARSCRAHHPRINEVAVLIKELITQFRIPPYNEPIIPGGTVRSSSAVSTASRRPPIVGPARRGNRVGSGAARQQSRAGPTASFNRPYEDAGPRLGSHPAGEGTLRYLQLTAVPSNPGNRAEEDPLATVQVVLVLNVPPDCEPTDPRVAAVMQLCRLLWRLVGPGGPMVPTADSPPVRPPRPSFAQREPGAAISEPVEYLLEDGGAQPGDVSPLPGRSALKRRKGTITGDGGVLESKSAEVAETASSRQPMVHSIWLNFQADARRNAILGESWRHVAGPAAAWQDFGGVAACVGPGSFVQANYGAMQLVLDEISSMVPDGSRVTELHAGIGVIGLSLAARRRLAALRCVEVNPAAAEPFQRSLELMRSWQQQQQPPQQQLPPVVEYLTAEAGSDPERFLADCDVLVVDPPRKGLGQSLLAALTRPPPTHGSANSATTAATIMHPTVVNTSSLAAGVLHDVGVVGSNEAVMPLGEPTAPSGRGAATVAQRLPSRLVYLSCGFRALQGDLVALLAGGWRLRSATAYMFFPGTDSLETLVQLSREEDGDC